VGHRLGEKSINGAFIGYIRHHTEGYTAGLRKRSDRRIDLLTINIIDHHLRPFGGIAVGNRSPNPLGRARDDGDFALHSL
jgi:hypothetical protein